jgi:hypothetical protein
MSILPLTLWIRNAAAALCDSFGAVSQQARLADCSRQTVYDHAHKVQTALELQQSGCPHCQQLRQDNQQLRRALQDAQQRLEHTIDCGPQRQAQLAVLLCALGVSINQILQVLLLLLGKIRCPSRATIGRWLRQAERVSGRVLALLDRRTQPAARLLAPDEIFFHGRPTLVAVEPASLAILLCRRAADRTGATWAAALQPFVNLEAVVSDAGTGLAAGLDAFEAARRQQRPADQPEVPPLERSLDVFHTEKEAQVVLARLWRQVEGAWEKAEAADRQVAKDKREWYDARGSAARARAAWRRAEAAFAAHERAEQAWQRAKAALALWRADGQLNDRRWAEQEIAAACGVLRGPAWRKVCGLLQDRRALVFLDRLHRRLEVAEPRAELRGALVELVRLEQAARTGAAAALGACLAQRVVCARQAADWKESYARVAGELAQVVRASSVVECVNSVLRMHQGRHRGMSQGLLDLKRLYWNTRMLGSGRRKGQCPYQLLGVPLPSYDFWTLLQADPVKLEQQLSTLQVAA